MANFRPLFVVQIYNIPTTFELLTIKNVGILTACFAIFYTLPKTVILNTEHLGCEFIVIHLR